MRPAVRPRSRARSAALAAAVVLVFMALAVLVVSLVLRFGPRADDGASGAAPQRPVSASAAAATPSR